MQLQAIGGVLASAALIANFAGALAGCGDDGATSGSGGGGGGEQCGIQACDAGSGGDAEGASDGAGGADGACGLESVAHDEFCADGRELDCGAVGGDDAYELCGVALAEPGDESGADASCFEAGSYPPPPGAVGSTRLQGHVRIFSNGCESSSVTVEVFTIADDGQLGARIGISATTPASCVDSGEAVAAEDCDGGVRYECAYVYPSVPTETLLAIKTSGADWTPIIDYGVFITNDAAASGAYGYDPHALATDDYGVLSQAAVGHPVTPGNGMILGEVRDCGGAPVAGAVVGTDASPQALVYFTASEDNPLPDSSAVATPETGIWAAIDAAPGAARVAAAVAQGDDVVAIGERDVRILPDTVTWVTFQGPLPTQVDD